MVKTGDVIENPITGERVEFLQTAEDTGGELLQFRLVVQPGGFVTAQHIHPSQEERFMIKAGTIRLRIGKEERTLFAGEEGIVPPGTPHAWWNTGSEPFDTVVEFRPALRLADFLATFFALAKDGKTNAQGMPNLLRMAVIFRKYLPETTPVFPALGLKIICGPIARLGDWMGYLADNPYAPEPARTDLTAPAPAD
jgi:quercetin dioxygenase-like cupin family protein